MKKRILKIMLCVMICGTFTIGNFQSSKANIICSYKNQLEPTIDTINVIIYDEQTADGQAVMAAFDKYWTFSKIRFISPEEFVEINNDKNKFFLSKMFYDYYDKSGKITESDIYYIIFKGGNKLGVHKGTNCKISFNNIEKNHGYSAILYKMFYYSSAKGYTKWDYFPIYVADFNSRIGNLVDGNEVYTKSDNKTLYLFNNTTLDSLKGKTLFIDKSYSQTENYLISSQEDTLRSIYSKALGIPMDSVVVLEKEEILKLFETGNKDYIYLLGNLNAYVKILGMHSALSAIVNYKGKNLVWVNPVKENRISSKKTNKE
jgi:hypothetical protein